MNKKDIKSEIKKIPDQATAVLLLSELSKLVSSLIERQKLPAAAPYWEMQGIWGISDSVTYVARVNRALFKNTADHLINSYNTQTDGLRAIARAVIEQLSDMEEILDKADKIQFNAILAKFGSDLKFSL